MHVHSKPAKIGIFAGFTFDVPFHERMNFIHDAGFHSTALWWEERHPEGRRLRHLAPAVVREAGLEIDHIHVPYHDCANLWSKSKADRLSAVEQHIEWVRDCSRHRIPCMVMHVAAGPGTPGPNKHGIDSFHTMLEVAEDLDVAVAIENTRRPEHVDFLLAAIASPALALCFDTSHDRLYAESPFALLHNHGRRLATTHVSDTDGRRDLHLLPGEGVCEYDSLSRTLREAPADLILEVRQRDQEESPEDYLARAYRAANEILNATTQETHHAR